MPINSKHVAAEIRSFAKKLMALAEKVAPTLAPLKQLHDAADRDRLVADRICLNCGRPVPKDELYKRGLDNACYQLVRTRQKDEGRTDGEMVAAGYKAPQKPGGRPRGQRGTPIDAMETEVSRRKTEADRLARVAVQDEEPKRGAKRRKVSGHTER